jgi:hypothetical protein
MNVEIGAEAALFPEEEYIKGIFVAVNDCRLEHSHIRISGFYLLYTVRG